MLNATIPSHDRKSFGAYIAKAAKPDAPVMVVIQEIFGVNEGLRKMCDDWAAKGFHAICPDLFWRIEPGIELSDHKEAEMQKAFELFNEFDVELGVQDLLSTIKFARSFDSSKVGTVGYCLGGKLAFLMALNSDADCNISYYGVGLDEYAGEAGRIKKPLLMHIAENDKFVPAEARETILTNVEKNPAITAYVYEGVDHAFARVGGTTYVAAAAEPANVRTLEFAEKYLKG